MKKSVIVSAWLSTAVVTLLVSLSTIHLLTKPRYVPMKASQHNQQVLGYRSAISNLLTSNKITADDARPILIAEFLKAHNSPLRPYDHFGRFFVETADKYGLDYRLLPAIAMQESNLCKKIPPGSFNCLGLGIHSRGTWHFESFEANFDKAAEILRKNYVDEGLITPAQIQSKYTPHSNGSWQFAVNQFMDRIESGDY